MYKLLITLLFCIGSVTAHAATDEFIVSLTFGSDTTPPTTPTGLTATPVASTQVDLAWASSTDDVAMGGYQVFRDAVQIATTTSITYSDTGLSADTLYNYYIVAFDSSFNYATATAVVSTTTLAIATTTPTSGGGGGEKIELEPIPIEITALEVIPGTHAATIRYSTLGYVKPSVHWGETYSYEIGSAAGRSFSQVHETTINDLQPGTTYYFKIEGVNRLGTAAVLTEGVFETRELDDDQPPANVTNLRVSRVLNDVVLSWDNPRMSDFAKVRVLRSDIFYPTDPYDGWLVYEGSGSEAFDTGMAASDRVLYYTVFTYDDDGDSSSGAVVQYIPKGHDPVVVPPAPDPDAPTPTTTPTSTPASTFSFADVEFWQHGALLPHEETTVAIDGSQQLMIAIPYTALPRHLKTILVTLGSAEDPEKTFTILLRMNEERTAYTAVLAPLGVAGVYPVSVAVFDYNTRTITRTNGTLYAEIVFARETGERLWWEEIKQIVSILMYNYLLWFILLLIILLLVARRLIKSGE